MKEESEVPIETQSDPEPSIHTSTEPNIFREILTNLRELPADKIRQRDGGKNKDGSRNSFAYVPWNVVADLLDQHASDWSHAVKDIRELGGLPVVIVSLTIQGCTREGIGTGGSMSETGIKKAEHDALKRAAVKFGIGRELYEKESDHIDRQGSRPENDFDINNPPQPATFSDPRYAASDAQASLIFKLGRKLDMNPDEECHARLRCSVAELNKRAASWLITYFKMLEAGEIEAARAMAAASAAPDSVDRPSKVEGLTVEQLADESRIERIEDGYRIKDVIKDKTWDFRVTKSGGAVTCTCGPYKTAAFNGDPYFRCTHKLAIAKFAAK